MLEGSVPVPPILVPASARSSASNKRVSRKSSLSSLFNPSLQVEEGITFNELVYNLRQHPLDRDNFLQFCAPCRVVYRTY